MKKENLILVNDDEIDNAILSEFNIVGVYNSNGLQHYIYTLQWIFIVKYIKWKMLKFGSKYMRFHYT